MNFFVELHGQNLDGTIARGCFAVFTASESLRLIEMLSFKISQSYPDSSVAPYSTGAYTVPTPKLFKILPTYVALTIDGMGE